MSVNETSTLPDYAKYFFNLGIMLAGFLAAVITAYGGIYYLVSFGRGKFTDEGKDWIKAGLTGLILTLFSYILKNHSLPATSDNGR